MADQISLLITMGAGTAAWAAAGAGTGVGACADAGQAAAARQQVKKSRAGVIHPGPTLT